MMKHRKTLLCLLTVWLVIAPTFAMAMATHLQDYAQVVSPEIAGRIEKLLAEIAEKKGLYIEEIILPSREGKSLNSVETMYTQRLEQDDTAIKKRVLLLIILDDHFAKLYSTENLSSVFSERISNDIVENVKHRLSEKRFDEMARIGVAGIYHYFEASQPKEKTNIKKNLIFFLVAIAAAIGLAYFIPKKNT
jgi:uncharacterized membrane protein YgcG